MTSLPPDFVTSVRDSMRLEAVTTCVGYDDFLDVTLAANMPHLDTMVVVTTPDDFKTQQVAKKYGAKVATTDVFHRDGKKFHKGAAVNVGFLHLEYRGWRLHLDADIVLSDNFRRILFNYTHLEPHILYGADRVHVVGEAMFGAIQKPQHDHIQTISTGLATAPRVILREHGYVPLGYFQLWNMQGHRAYTTSIGTAEHDDVSFALQWPMSHRQLLPSAIVYHLCTSDPERGTNWDGVRQTPRWGHARCVCEALMRGEREIEVGRSATCPDHPGRTLWRGPSSDG